mmetsp:Transcript_21606/g.71536  ORF Transcript_21606/g.71536 Transcript_21606/m.71536 type:complete len:218 (-) Transcript_21606:1599-2252(-)
MSESPGDLENIKPGMVGPHSPSSKSLLSLLGDSEDKEELKANADKLCLHASRFMQEKNLDAASNIYTKILKADQDNIKALHGLAILNHKRGMFDVARCLYVRSLAIQPNMYRTLYNLARLEHECNAYEAAAKYYGKALELGCDREIRCNSLAYLGLLHQSVWEDLARAKELYQQSLALDAQHVRTLDHFSALLVLQGCPEEAKEQHNLVMQLQPNHG